MDEEITKVCTHCEPPVPKPLSAFHRRKASSDGHAAICKECERKKHRAYYSRRKTKLIHRKSNLRIHYDMSVTEFNEMYEEQKGACAICKVTGRRLVIDHDHITGKRRQLLCDTCNHGLGRFKDSIPLLKEAVAYLERHNGTTTAA